MNEALFNVLISVISLVATGLASWGVKALIDFLNTKIQDKKLANFLTKITVIVTDAVQAVFQSFVETLKENGKFDEKAQLEAKQKAIDIIKGQLTADMKQYIEANFGDIEEWISVKIESIIYALKRTPVQLPESEEQ